MAEALVDGRLAVSDQLAALIPQPAQTMPKPEKTGASPGMMPKEFAMADHQHPRLTSVTGATASMPNSHTIRNDGLSLPVMFTRAFSAEPGIDIMAIKPNATDILLPPYSAFPASQSSAATCHSPCVKIRRKLLCRTENAS